MFKTKSDTYNLKYVEFKHFLRDRFRRIVNFFKIKKYIYFLIENVYFAKM